MNNINTFKINKFILISMFSIAFLFLVILALPKKAEATVWASPQTMYINSGGCGTTTISWQSAQAYVYVRTPWGRYGSYPGSGSMSQSICSPGTYTYYVDYYAYGFWGTEGITVYVYQNAPTYNYPMLSYFYPSPNQINSGSGSTIYWGAYYGNSYYQLCGQGINSSGYGCYTYGGGNYNGGSYTVYPPPGTYSYSLLACNPSYCNSWSTQLTVVNPTPSIYNFYSSPNQINLGNYTNLYWSWGNVYTGTICGSGVYGSSNSCVSVSSATTSVWARPTYSGGQYYTLYAYNSNGVYTSLSAYLNVVNPVPQYFYITSVNASCSGNTNAFDIYWSYSPNATYYNVYRNGSYIGQTSGTSFRDYYDGNAYYQIVAANNYGSYYSGTFNGYAYDCSPQPYVSLSANPSTITSGIGNGATNLYWNSTSASFVGSSNFGASQVNGNTSVYPSAPSTYYYITVYNYRGTKSSSAGVNAYVDPGPFTLLPLVKSCNGSSPRVQLSWTRSSSATIYNIYRNGSYIGQTSGLTYTDTTAANLTSYNYYVAASNGRLAYSNQESVTTYYCIPPTAEISTYKSCSVDQKCCGYGTFYSKCLDYIIRSTINFTTDQQKAKQSTKLTCNATNAVKVELSDGINPVQTLMPLKSTPQNFTCTPFEVRSDNEGDLVYTLTVTGLSPTGNLVKAEKTITVQVPTYSATFIGNSLNMDLSQERVLNIYYDPKVVNNPPPGFSDSIAPVIKEQNP